MNNELEILNSVSEIEHQLDRAYKEINSIRDDVDRFVSYDNVRALSRAEDGLLQLNRICEQIAMSSRAIPERCVMIEKKTLLHYHVEEAFQCNIGYTSNNWLVIDIPPLMHKKHAYSKSDYIRENLRIVFQKFVEGIPAEKLFRFNNCTLVFETVYKKGKTNNHLYDYDSVEFVQATNKLADFFMCDDAMENIRKFLVSSSGAEERTRIYIVPNNEFAAFYDMFLDGSAHTLELFGEPQ